MADYRFPFRGSKPPQVFLATLAGDLIEELTNVFVSIDVMSSIDEPFIVANVMFSDPDELAFRHRLNGDHALVIEAAGGNDRSFKLLLHINSVSITPHSNRKSNSIVVNCIAPEHIYNTGQQIKEYKFSSNAQPISEIIRYIAKQYLAIDLKGNAVPQDDRPLGNSPATTPPVKINIPQMHPVQAIAMLSNRCHGIGEDTFCFYQRLDKDGIPQYRFDEISELARKEPVHSFIMQENSIGEASANLDKSYMDGQPVSKTLSYNVSTFFDAQKMIMQGVYSKSVEIDFLNGIVNEYGDEGERRPPVIGEQRLTGLQNYILGQREKTYFVDSSKPDEKLHESFSKRTQFVKGLLNNTVTISSYGLTNIGPGDVVEVQRPAIDPDGKPKEIKRQNLLVHSARHTINLNGEVASVFECMMDGEPE